MSFHKDTECGTFKWREKCVSKKIDIFIEVTVFLHFAFFFPSCELILALLVAVGMARSVGWSDGRPLWCRLK